MVKIEDHEYLCTEEKRLRQDSLREKYWKKWGPYVAERQWATGTLSSNQSRDFGKLIGIIHSARGLQR